MANRQRRLGVVMDPIAAIQFKKDTTLAFLLEAQQRGYQLHYLEPGDLVIRDGVALGSTRLLTVADNSNNWYALGDSASTRLGELDVILMRKDPPFDMEYIYATYVLEVAELQGACVVNRPSSLRDINEKGFIQRFPDCCAPTLIARDREALVAFIAEHGKAVVKPMDGMGGRSVFVISMQDPNFNVILETITENETRTVMAQKFIPEITAGDKRILLINGEPFPHALARIPRAGESRGNLAAGGRAEGVDLSERDFWICSQVKDELLSRGVLFAGLDVIGDYLTEINVTSPTCVRELDAIYDTNISARLFDAIEAEMLPA